MLPQKTLKFSPDLIPLVLNGSKTSTWRLWDEKNLQVGDQLTFIKRPELIPFATAEITDVIEKPVSEMTVGDKQGHEKFPSVEAMCQTYSDYYHRPVTPTTSIKIITFKLLQKL